VVTGVVRRRLVVAGRLVNLTFFLLTSLYCLLESSPFANEQFIKPGVAGWLADFVVFHTDFYWLALSVTALTMAPFLEGPRGRVIGWSYLLSAAAVGVWLSVHRVLPDPQDPGGALFVAMAALVPPAWVALFDHAVLVFPRVGSMRTDRRLLVTCAGAAVFSWLTFAVAVPFRLAGAGLTITTAELSLGVALAAAAHASSFLLLLIVLSAVAGLAAFFRPAPRVEYAGLAAVSALLATSIVGWVVLAPIAVTGVSAWLFSAVAASTLTAVWSGVALQRFSGAPSSEAGETRPTVLDAWCAPLAGRSRRAQVVALCLLPFAAYAAVKRVSMFDWDFMIQKLGAVAVALAAFAWIHAAIRGPSAGGTRRAPGESGRPPWPSPGTAAAAGAGAGAGVGILFFAILTIGAIGTIGATVLLPSVERRLHAGAAFDAYLAADPSLRLARDLTAKRDESSAAFYAFLRANTGIKVDVRPIDISFVTSFKGFKGDKGFRAPSAAQARPPHVFLFVIDSLRRDYVSSYNPAVTFTPSIDAFARESVAFGRAFSRYGGTGLSVPAIWAGGMIVHKEYVTPFAPMNALAKLLDAHDYRRFITADHITNELFPRAPGTIDLDRGVPEMKHTFCRTMSELESRLAGTSDDPRPIFAHTRPLDLHIGNVWSATVPAGETYPGFLATYAARVRRIDACFGGFVDFLRRERLYDDSVIIFTADHGDSLGEGLRWGHGFTVFPEVLAIPLIVHLPSRVAALAADTDRVSFTVDITPTLYALLGDAPSAHEPQYGAPLFAPSISALTDRRQESFLVASSYGAVYGLLSANGTRLYIADAINGREYAFELAGRADGTRVGLTDTQRDSARQIMRAQLEAIAADYRYQLPAATATP
jgi:hypothetical protein